MKIGAIIISGGKSSRFGSDKGLFLFKNKPLIQYSIDACKAFTNDIIIISGNTDYEQFNYRVISDIYPNSGPMGGIHTGLKNSEHDINIVLSSDTPFVNADLIKLLTENYNKEDILITQTSDGKFQTLLGIYHKRTYGKFEEELSNHHFKMIQFIKQMNYRALQIPSNSPLEKCFINFNYQSELKEYEH